MNLYKVALPLEDKMALAAARSGIRRIGAIGRPKDPQFEGIFGCELELVSGEVILVEAGQYDLEYKFEVFPIKAVVASSFTAHEAHAVVLQPPVEVHLLETADWLDPSIPCEGAIGQNPIMQCQGLPIDVPVSAVAACQYFGGVEFRGSNGESILIATLPFPYAIHVSAFERCGKVDRATFNVRSVDDTDLTHFV
ncbi:hypothetical protein [Silvimonas iriomotensis]|uniref:Uncharacterized protein n=1 Tax=Silvimonas iriomotensis TaxID=449662 RepID=A0ABQ2PAK6_9NEIS|nr:hypothetical protein [Silvimonas iriomotensis]GGP22047.1 hypothetical protein GCM10010970_23150 [Silvimonas iriomotensis]